MTGSSEELSGKVQSDSGGGRSNFTVLTDLDKVTVLDDLESLKQKIRAFSSNALRGP